VWGVLDRQQRTVRATVVPKVNREALQAAVHCDLIKETQVTILATAHNSAENVGEWVEGLIRAKAKAERHFKKTQRPWFATFTRDGDIHIQTIGQQRVCCRNRPQEMEASSAKMAGEDAKKAS